MSKILNIFADFGRNDVLIEEMIKIRTLNK